MNLGTVETKIRNANTLNTKKMFNGHAVTSITEYSWNLQRDREGARERETKYIRSIDNSQTKVISGIYVFSVANYTLVRTEC